jgi:hypothetical protein
VLSFFSDEGCISEVARRTGGPPGEALEVAGASEVHYAFTSDSSRTDWGYR